MSEDAKIADESDMFPAHELAESIRQLRDASIGGEWGFSDRLSREHAAKVLAESVTTDGQDHGGNAVVFVARDDKPGPWVFITGHGPTAEANARLVCSLIQWLPQIIHACEVAYPKPGSYKWRIVEAMVAASEQAKDVIASLADGKAVKP